MQFTMKLPGRLTTYAAAIFVLVLTGIAVVPVVCETCTQCIGMLENYWTGMAREIENLYAVHP